MCPYAQLACMEKQQSDRGEQRPSRSTNQPSIQEMSYSTKIPMRPMRHMGGFDTANGMYYNPRTMVTPDQDLLDLTPFAFAFEACPIVEEAVAGTSKSYTALTVLRFFKDMATVFLQDCAAMWTLHPERREHPIFSMPIFSTPLWEVSTARDRCHRCRSKF